MFDYVIIDFQCWNVNIEWTLWFDSTSVKYRLSGRATANTCIHNKKWIYLRQNWHLKPPVWMDKMNYNQKIMLIKRWIDIFVLSANEKILCHLVHSLNFTSELFFPVFFTFARFMWSFISKKRLWKIKIIFDSFITL